MNEEEQEEGFLSSKEVPGTTIPVSSSYEKSEGLRVKDMDREVRRLGRKTNKEIRQEKMEKDKELGLQHTIPRQLVRLEFKGG